MKKVKRAKVIKIISTEKAVKKGGLDWIKTSERLPTESGEYFIARRSPFGTWMYDAYQYSSIHKAFNAFDSQDKAFVNKVKIDVDYWAHINAPEEDQAVIDHD